MARPARARPLQAPPRFTPVSADGEVVGETPGPVVARRRSGRGGGRLRSIALGLGVGSATALAGIAIAFSIVAIPLFFVASTEPGSGAHRDLVHKGLFFVALPFGAVAGTLVGIVVGVWYGRGGRLPEHRERLYDR